MPNDEADWVVVRDAHKPLVARRVWEAAQERLRTNPVSIAQRGVNPRTDLPVESSRPFKPGWTGPRAKFLLTGLCACARCGARYEGYTQRGKMASETGERSKRLSYACGGSIRRGKHVCALGEVPQDHLQQAVIEAAIAFYKRYDGKAGRARLVEAATDGLVLKQQEAERQREQARKSLAKTEGAIRALLDNLTSANRAHVDQRIVELEREREAAVAELERLDRMALDDVEAAAAADRAAAFIGSLESAPTEAPLDQRVTAIRRCVKRAVVDSDRRSVAIEFWTVPTNLGRCEPNATELVTASLAVRHERGDRKRKAGARG